MSEVLLHMCCVGSLVVLDQRPGGDHCGDRPLEARKLFAMQLILSTLGVGAAEKGIKTPMARGRYTKLS